MKRPAKAPGYAEAYDARRPPLLLATNDGEPGGCSSDVECALTAGEPEPPAMEERR